MDVTASPFIANGLIIEVTAAAPAALNADFTADVTVGPRPLTVNFSDASIAGSQAITDYEWRFGDGTLSVDQNPSKLYVAAGQFDVTLIVTDAGGATDTTTKAAFITVQGAPTADFSASVTSGPAPLVVNFTDNSTAGIGAPGTGNIVSYDWDFGDGSSSSLQNPSHTYASTGVYDVTLNRYG